MSNWNSFLISKPHFPNQNHFSFQNGCQWVAKVNFPGVKWKKTRIPYLNSHRFLPLTPVAFVYYSSDAIFEIIQAMQYLKKTTLEKIWIITIHISTLPKLTLNFCKLRVCNFCKHDPIFPACSVGQHSYTFCQADEGLGHLETSQKQAPSLVVPVCTTKENKNPSTPFFLVCFKADQTIRIS